jgi:hypothetical protein
LIGTGVPPEEPVAPEENGNQPKDNFPWLFKDENWETSGITSSIIERLKEDLLQAVSIIPESILAEKLHFTIVPDLYQYVRFETNNRLVYSFNPPEDYAHLGSAVLIHEFFLALLHESLAKHVPKIAPHYERVKKMIQLNEVKFFEYDRPYLQESIDQARHENRQADAQRLQESLEDMEKKYAEYLDVKNFIELDVKISQLILPYNQLWADTGAVTTLRKLDAMSFFRSGKHRGDYRNFGAFFDSRGWKERDEHTLLTPVRTYLGQYYLNNIFSMSDPCRTRFLAILFQAIGGAILNYLPNVTKVRPSVEQMNLDLIFRLEQFLPQFTQCL